MNIQEMTDLELSNYEEQLFTKKQFSKTPVQLSKNPATAGKQIKASRDAVDPYDSLLGNIALEWKRRIAARPIIESLSIDLDL
jgi:hypothetical protein